MHDRVDKPTRSRIMSAIKGKDTKPELRVRRYLHRHGLRLRLHGKLPGRPDLVFAGLGAVVFVHGCFWHQHAGCDFAYKPKSNASFWAEKLSRNAARDSEAQQALEHAGWRVFTIWECELRSEASLATLAAELRSIKEERASRRVRRRARDAEGRPG